MQKIQGGASAPMVQISTTVLNEEIVDVFVSNDLGANYEALKQMQPLEIEVGVNKVSRGKILSISSILIPVSTSPIATAQPTVSIMLTVMSEKVYDYKNKQ